MASWSGRVGNAGVEEDVFIGIDFRKILRISSRTPPGAADGTTHDEISDLQKPRMK
jgi:hypothetical protein